MKTFRVHLKDGKSFTITAHSVSYHTGDRVYVYKAEKVVDTDIILFVSEVVAVVPEETKNEKPVRSSSGVPTR